MSSYDRRRALGALALGGAALALGGCGFHLRGAANYHFDSIYVNAPGAPAFGADVRKALASSSTAKIVDDPAKAQVILDITLVVDDKDVLSLSPGGRAREFALQKRVQLRLRDNAGNNWLPPDEIVIRRTYLYDDTERLARQIEENRLVQEMQADAVQQIVRRLQAARKPA
jgi:LPS-assembly lipoprotein